MTDVIIGATGGLGRALADRLAAKGRGLILVARDETALSAMAADLKTRHGTETTCIAADAAKDAAYLDEVSAAARRSGGIQSLLLPIGRAVRDDLTTAPDTLRDLAATNFLAVTEAVTRLWPLLAEGGATVVGFGSITATRGRGRNFVYGAMKRALQSYFESLRIAARGTPVKVQFWVVGFLNTDAMRDEKTPLPKGDPAVLAKLAVDALGCKSCVGHFPRWWRAVAWVLRRLPWGIYVRVAGRG